MGHYRRSSSENRLSQALVCCASVQPQRPTFSLAGAGSVLIGFTTACIAAGTLIGWAAGGVGYGLAAGAVVGVPVGVAVTVIKYRNA
jgi:hypothetical protein